MFPTENDIDWIDLHLQSAVYHINEAIRMNIRLRELEASRHHVTPLPAQPTVSNQPMSGITGASHLADSIKARIQAAKDRMANATSNADMAVNKLNAAADASDQLSNSISKEADDLMAQIGQFSNGSPA